MRTQGQSPKKIEPKKTKQSKKGKGRAWGPSPNIGHRKERIGPKPTAWNEIMELKFKVQGPSGASSLTTWLSSPTFSNRHVILWVKYWFRKRQLAKAFVRMWKRVVHRKSHPEISKKLWYALLLLPKRPPVTIIRNRLFFSFYFDILNSLLLPNIWNVYAYEKASHRICGMVRQGRWSLCCNKRSNICPDSTDKGLVLLILGAQVELVHSAFKSINKALSVIGLVVGCTIMYFCFAKK